MASFGLKSLSAYNSESDQSEDDDCSGPGILSAPKRPRLEDHELKVDFAQPPGHAKKADNGGIKLIKDSARLPSVPEDILRMFPTTEGIPKDDPSLHMGRTRSFPHVRGNWASYVYIKCPDKCTMVTQLQNAIHEAVQEMNSQQLVHLINEKHLSLSRTIPFRHHWIEPFVTKLKNTIGCTRNFNMYFGEFEAYTNDEKSRTFISLQAVTSHNLINLVRKCDEALEEFQLETYYRDPSFHISFAWMIGDKKSWTEENLLPLLNEKWLAAIDNDPTIQFLPVTDVEFKTGNELYRFNLKSCEQPSKT